MNHSGFYCDVPLQAVGDSSSTLCLIKGAYSTKRSQRAISSYQFSQSIVLLPNTILVERSHIASKLIPPSCLVDRTGPLGRGPTSPSQVRLTNCIYPADNRMNFHLRDCTGVHTVNVMRAACWSGVLPCKRRLLSLSSLF